MNYPKGMKPVTPFIKQDFIYKRDDVSYKATAVYELKAIENEVNWDEEQEIQHLKNLKYIINS